QDLKAFRSACIDGISAGFRLPVGRRRSAQLDRAERLRKRGKGWNAIFLEIETDYAQWDTYRRQAFRQGVQAALRRRKSQRKKLHARKRRESSQRTDSSSSKRASNPATLGTGEN